MKSKQISTTPQSQTSDRIPYQTPKLEVHNAYTSLTAGISFPIGANGTLPSVDQVFSPSEVFNPTELGL
jgi:hypothetical protein